MNCLIQPEARARLTATLRESWGFFERSLTGGATRDIMSDADQHGPSDNDDPESNTRACLRHQPWVARDQAAFREEIVDYFTARLPRLKIVKTTTTARGPLLD